MAKRVRDLMKKNPISLESPTPVVEAARRMQAANVGAVIVTDKGKLVGILTDRDIAIRLVAHAGDPSTTPVADICSPLPATLSPDDDLERAIEIMRKKAVRRIPVVDADKRTVGIVSLGDLALERDPQSVLGEISGASPSA
jgi:CBS domain-containing protein